jgi:hypothetical protein
MLEGGLLRLLLRALAAHSGAGHVIGGSAAAVLRLECWCWQHYMLAGLLLLF